VALPARRSRLRGLFHHKDADWKDNTADRLAGVAEELAKMPTTTSWTSPTTCRRPWQRNAVAARDRPVDGSRYELAVYSGEYHALGFKRPEFYRSRSGGAFESELQLFSGGPATWPSIFISARVIGAYQRPERRAHAGHRVRPLRGCHCRRAGHWVPGQSGARRRIAAGLPEGARGVAGPSALSTYTASLLARLMRNVRRRRAVHPEKGSPDDLGSRPLQWARRRAG